MILNEIWNFVNSSNHPGEFPETFSNIWKKFPGYPLSHRPFLEIVSGICLYGLKRNSIFRNNICYGATNPEEITDEEIIEMAKKSNALEFINQLPDGLDTQIGERKQLHL